MASVDVVGVRRPGGAGRREMSMTLSSLVTGMAGLTAGTPLVLSHCARPNSRSGCATGYLPAGIRSYRGDPEKLCKTTWQDVHYQARPVVGGLRPAALGTLIGNQ